MSAMRADNQRLNHQVVELRADRRIQDRKVRDLEHQLDMARAKIVTSIMDAPPLPVEVMGAPPPPASDGANIVGIADDGAEIVYEGDAAAGKRADEDIALPPSPSPAQRPTRVIAARSSPAPRRDARPTERNDAAEAAEGEYRDAVELVKAGKHDDAVAALRAFVSRHPQHDYADNAQYWLGEAYYAHKDYPRALAEFRTVIETYPRGNKVPDALLKVGYCYQAMGQAQKARAVLEQVVNLYPKTEPAAIAAKRLEQP